VAGAVSGWQEALSHSQRLGGRLPLSRLLEDAIRYARDGAPVTRSQVDLHDPLPARARRGCRALPGSSSNPARALPPARLATLRCRAPTRCAATLRWHCALQTLARRGLDDFYRGELAAAIADEHARLGGPLALADLQAHRARTVAPLQVALQGGATLYNMTPPTQGLASLMILAIFDRLRQRHAITEVDSLPYLHAMVEATKQAFKRAQPPRRRPRRHGRTRPSPARFLGDDFIGQCADAVDMERALPWPEPAIPGDTIWMGTADRSGRMVSYIQSVYWEFGSGVVLSDTGIVWQNRGSSFQLDARSHLALAPGKQPFHTLNPAHARLADGRHMVYGNMGGDGQPQTQSAVFSRYALYGQSLQQAVTAPRWLLGKTWGQESTTLKFERRFDPAALDGLRRRGHDVELLDEFSDTMGHAGAIVRQPDGLLLGAADPRSDGAVAGY
jgi:gamma-glutamyltranspeptidase